MTLGEEYINVGVVMTVTGAVARGGGHADAGTGGFGLQVCVVRAVSSPPRQTNRLTDR